MKAVPSPPMAVSFVTIKRIVLIPDGCLGVHLQAEGAGDFADAGDAGGTVVGRYVARVA